MNRFFLTTAFSLATAAAQAHPGTGHAHGIAAGLYHPLGGLDHVLAMAAVGLLGYLLGGCFRWLLPAAFLGMMVLGGAVSVSGITLPAVEAAIVLSVIIIGALILIAPNVPGSVALAMTGFFAVFHGHAHVAEMPLDGSATSYALGFVLTSALLHAAGAALGAGVAAIGGSPLVRLTGGAVTGLGLGILAGLI
ncbi:HupE/UreJ family protein (plasmid) [Aminobacter sp. SR38]|jgi:urease accessory protein|uniref:HupE/UreJ family protein n=1 Tax=Aminobacter sp. SR38 TaxID=2774562 RepID=UPI00177D390F|nr:HupE/UreJ family protein [Aminobacter sp. SR38]QOF75126.1 HupE/UreJ family protein [Aminobacter sp. SR38]